MTRIAILFALIAAVYGVICCVAFLLQRSLLYLPTPALDAAGADRISINSSSETINVWRSGARSQNALIYFGGNAESVALSQEDYRVLFPQHAIYSVEYRGYGLSSGTPTESGLLSDALAVFDQIADQHERIVVVGRSLGSGLATHLAARRSVDALILVTPYDSILAVAQSHFPWLPVRLLLKDRFHSIANAPSISAPTLIIIAANDQVIEPSHSERLAAAFTADVVSKVMIPNTDHNDVSNSPMYRQALRAHIEQQPSNDR